jgi:hypothetical protein
MDDMLITRPGSWLVESLAKRGVRPAVTGHTCEQRAQRKHGNTNHKICFSHSKQEDDPIHSFLGSYWRNVQQVRLPMKGTREDASILIKRGAPRHAGVVDEDVDLIFLGLNGLDEVVATSL